MFCDHLPGSNLQVNEYSNLKSPDFGFCYPVCTFKLYHKAFPITTMTGLGLRGTRHNDLFSRISLLLLPREENGNPLQHSCLGNPMDRGAWWVHGVAKSQTWLERLKPRSCPDDSWNRILSSLDTYFLTYYYHNCYYWHYWAGGAFRRLPKSKMRIDVKALQKYLKYF